ncbi:MAG: homoserine dehydrogenase [Clostridia bacterium]|nr:homoserine dehydrogenase [Clostridia bacterium]
MNIAVMGFGVVGSGVVELFEKNHEMITEKSMQDAFDLKYILDIRDFPDSPYADKMVKDFNIILNDASVGIVVETMGGLHPAYEFVSALLNAGKSVVSSNKELVAEKGLELLEIAKEKNVNFLFEASVGGGIPIIRPISQCLAANEIAEVAGILNGTTNFILTKMIDEQMDFDTALRLAQQLGYAEKDPTADVDGIDASRKICILASLCFGKHVYPNVVRTEGIRKISLRDVAYAADSGNVIKLLGVARKAGADKLVIFVSPCLVGRHSQLAGANDVFNAILVRGDAIGDVVFYGRGAGKFPTASAVVADVIDCGKHVNKRKFLGWSDSAPDYVIDSTAIPGKFYVRGTGSADAFSALADVKRLSAPDAPANEAACICAAASEKALLADLSAAGFSAELVMPVTDY